MRTFGSKSCLKKPKVGLWSVEVDIDFLFAYFVGEYSERKSHFWTADFLLSVPLQGPASGNSMFAVRSLSHGKKKIERFCRLLVCTMKFLRQKKHGLCSTSSTITDLLGNR